MFDKQWVFNSNRHKSYIEHCKIRGKEPSFIEELLFQRGIEGTVPGIEGLSNPYDLPDLEQAVERILKAAEEEEIVAVFGDYDADGVTAAAVLYHFMKNMLELETRYYIPDRLSEGYGMSCAAIDTLHEQGVKLIVTVDNGIVAFDEIAYASELGIDVVVTDHHRCGERLPDACAVVDPCILTEETPAAYLCGAGVAFALIRGLAEAVGLFDEVSRYIPIVAIGTLGDAVPLKGDNRILAKYGLEHLRGGEWTGLDRLIAKITAGKKERTQLSSTFVLFYIVPKLNAAGRLGNAGRAFQLLISEDAEEAEKLAEELIQENAKRQATEAEITNQALETEHIMTSDGDAVAIAVGDDWHPGVIGIVASRLVEKYQKPSFVLAQEREGVLKGSARSVKGFDLFQALSGCSGLLEKFGGHEMAAGLSLKSENLRPFIDSLNKFASEHSNYRSEPPNLEIDAVVLPEELTIENVARISDLEPYGTGNPQPVICVRHLRIAQCSKVGDQGKHLKFSFYRELPDGKRIYLDGVAFSQGAYEAMVRSITDVCSVVCKVELNEWMGKKRVSLLVSDVFDGDYTVEHGAQCVYNDDYVTCRGFAVDRGKLAVLYKRLLSYGDSFKFSDLYQIRRNIRSLGAECTWYEIRNGIDIFTELGLVRRKDKQNFTIKKQSGKLELTSSNIYCRAQVKG